MNSKSLATYYSDISSSAMHTLPAPSTTDELTKTLETLTEMENKHEAYIMTHCFVIRFFLRLCWWEGSVHGSYLNCRTTLAGRVAIGYEDKLLTLLFCKHVCEHQLHKDFFSLAFKVAISNIYQQTEAKGFCWKITSATGISHYLIGTIHKGTSAFAKARGVQEAINHSELFFTEAGLPTRSLFKSPYRLDHLFRDWNWRWFFCLDFYVTYEAYRRKKKIYALDTEKLRKETEAKYLPGEGAMYSLKGYTLRHVPPKFLLDRHGSQYTKYKKAFEAEFDHAGIPQQIQLLQSGDEKRNLDFKKQLESSKNLEIDCNERSKAWLQHSYEDFEDPDKQLPGLVDRITNSTQSICITVGACHCFGYDVSLVEEFRKIGCTVTRI